MTDPSTQTPSTQTGQAALGGPMPIERFGKDREGLVQSVSALLERVHDSSHDYMNTADVASLPTQLKLGNGASLAWSIGLDLKDLCVLAAIIQAPMSLRGATDKGKTALAERALSGLFGPQGQGWWRIEVNRGITIDDLVDIDFAKLSDSHLSEAISAASWLALPAILLDEFNRSHPKLINMLLHIVDGSGLNVRGNLTIPIGMPYSIAGAQKRYSLAVLTANDLDASTPGVFEDDVALRRRIVLSWNLDESPVTSRDVAQLISAPSKRAKSVLPVYDSVVESVIRVYESLPETLSFSALAWLLLHYLWGLGTCVQTKSGRLRTKLTPGICNKCHLAKAHPSCGRVGGLSEGLLLWCKEAATGIAAIRAAKVLNKVREDCLAGRHAPIQKALGVKAEGEALYAEFKTAYVQDLSVQGEDVVAAFALLAPGHVWISPDYLHAHEEFENSETYAFGAVGRKSWASLQQRLREHEELFGLLSLNGEVAPEHQAEVEAMGTTEDAAMLAVIAALREQPVPLKCRETARHN